jgi:hypothetical protein
VNYSLEVNATILDGLGSSKLFGVVEDVLLEYQVVPKDPVKHEAYYIVLTLFNFLKTIIVKQNINKKLLEEVLRNGVIA